MAVNNLLAAPGFSAWMEGEPLDVQRLLYTPEGKPRLTILSIAHLDDAERMFFVSLLLNQVLGWMRQQPGTTSLRAIVYMDEIFGYLPPVANPPSKAPMLTLLKQARAFGVGMVLATQNPVDLDYKALSNAGTWFIGRLQTERDQARVLDGLEGAMSTAGGAFDRDDAAEADRRPGQARVPAAQRPRRRPGGVRDAVGDVVPARPADADADQDADGRPQGRWCRTRHASTRHAPGTAPGTGHPAPGTSARSASAPHPPSRLRPLGAAPRHPAVLRAGQAGRALRADDRRRGQRAVHRHEGEDRRDATAHGRHAAHRRSDPGELGAGRTGDVRRRAAVDGAAVGRDVRRAAGRGEQGEELRRVDQGRLSPGCPPPSRSTSSAARR